MFKSDKHEVKLSDLKNKFYTAIPTLRKQLYEAVVSEGYFEESPETTRTTLRLPGRGGVGRWRSSSGFFFVGACGAVLGVASVRAGGRGGDRHRPDHPGPLHAAADREGRGSGGALAGVQALSAEPGEVHQGRGGHGDLRALPALCGGVRAGAELHPQVPEGGCAAADLVDPLRHPAALLRRRRRSARRRRDTCPATPRRCRARGRLGALAGRACRAAWAARWPA